jgi:hypothetical protein
MVPSLATISPRGYCVDVEFSLGLSGDLSSAAARKNCIFTDCTATITKSRRIIVARMLKRRDTSYPFLAVVVVVATVVVVVPMVVVVTEDV